jgi:hypothetical protein
MNNLHTNFFAKVAAHNLERFHSETIAWLFNSFPLAGKAFICSVYNIPDVGQVMLSDQFCVAEVNQIDIFISFTHNSKKYQIIIENKLKASEHTIDAFKLLKKSKSFDEYSSIFSEKEIAFLEHCLQNKVKLSQTEYYYFREKIERDSSVVECKYVYLKPTKINAALVMEANKKEFQEVTRFIDFEQLNVWDKTIGANPWQTITYSDLLHVINNSGAISTIEQAYQKQQHSFDLADCVIANSYLDYLAAYIKEDLNITDFNKNESYAHLDYFKMLFALVKVKFTDPSMLFSYSNIMSDKAIFEYVAGGSSNGGMPLFAFYKRIPVGKEFKCFNTTTTHINVGVQVQGDNFKYYVSSENVLYDKTKVIDQQFYKAFAEQLLFALDKSQGFKFNSNKTKTFFSRSYKINDFIEGDSELASPKDIFTIANEIAIKVNSFISNNTTKLVNSAITSLQ